jgi:hypothetical protein
LKEYSIQSIDGKTLINFTLSKKEMVNLSIFNLKGALVKTLINRKVNAGVKQQFSIKHDELGCGLYYCRVKTESLQSVKRVIIKK